MFHVKQERITFLRDNLRDPDGEDNQYLSNLSIEKILDFGDLVREMNQKINLVSPGDEAKIDTRHLLDSLQPLRLAKSVVESAKTWVDLGSGAGFPVVPLALALPHISFTAVEPRAKRCTFLRLAKQRFGIVNMAVYEGRAEAYTVQNADVVSCRALGSVSEDWQRACNLLTEQGCFITFRSLVDAKATEGWDGWVADSKDRQVLPYKLPGESQEYALLCVNRKSHG